MPAPLLRLRLQLKALLCLCAMLQVHRTTCIRVRQTEGDTQPDSFTRRLHFHRHRGMERKSEPRAQNLDIETRYNNHTLQGYAVPRSHPLTPSPGPSAIGPTIQWELAPTRIGIISSTAVGWDGRTEVGRNLSAVLLLENGVLCTIKVLVSSMALVHWLKQKQGSDLATTQRNEGNKRYSSTDMKMNEI